VQQVVQIIPKLPYIPMPEGRGFTAKPLSGRIRQYDLATELRIAPMVLT
jgi:hypothetical protein